MKMHNVFDNVMLIKTNGDSIVYSAQFDGKSVFLKRILTEERLIRMIREADIVKYLNSEEIGFLCPIIHRVGNTAWFYQEKINGEQYLTKRLNRKEKERVAEMLVLSMKQIHAIPIDYLKEANQPWVERFCRNLEDNMRQVQLNNILDYSVLIDIQKWIQKELSEVVISGVSTVIHNDINRDNFILNVENDSIKIGIIDFEKVTIADPLKELSKLIWIFRKDPEFGDLVFDSFCKTNFESNLRLLRLYFASDIISHLSMWPDLSRISKWKKYLNEEKQIISEIKRMRKLW